MKRKILALLMLVLLFFIVGCEKPSELERQQKEIYQLAVEVGYEGTFDQWLESIKGEQGIPGEDGKSVELTVGGDYIQWRNEGDTSWYNLISLNSLIGPNGSNGKEVTFQVAYGFIKWKYVGDSTWNNLVELSTLKGFDGQSAYDIYVDSHPEYTKTVNEWMNDLVNGRLADKETFSVDYNFNGGEVPDGTNLDQNVEKGKTVNLPLPTKEGYTFEGWASGPTVNDGIFTNTSPVFEDLTLYATYSENEYKLNYYDYSNFDFIKIASGNTHSIAITSDHKVYAWGTNSSGQLGDGTTTSRLKPIDITSSFNLHSNEWINNIDARAEFSIATSSGNRVFTWGNNSSFKLGDGTVVNRFMPTDISSDLNLDYDESIIDVSCGKTFAMIATSHSRVFGWGNSYYGQLTELYVLRTKPIEITENFNLLSNEKVVKIVSGESHGLMYTTYNRILSWGHNSYGQLGINSLIECSTPIDITNKFNLQTNEKVNHIVTGKYHSLLVTSNNRVFTWGDNTYGQLGDGTLVNKLIPTEITNKFSLLLGEEIIKVSTKDDHYILLTSSNRVFTWGYNNNGQLGNKTFVHSSLPIEIITNFNLQTNETINDVIAGFDFSFAITSTKQVYAWGNNLYGQFGNSTTSSRLTPEESLLEFQGELEKVITGGDHSFGITSTKRVFSWGYNAYGQLGDGLTTNRYIPIEITSRFGLLIGETIMDISVGDVHTFAITSYRRVFAWGNNDYCQLGDGTNIQRASPVTISFDLAIDDMIIKIITHKLHSFAITKNGKVFSWGANYNGQLGNGNNLLTMIPTEITTNFDLSQGEKITKIVLGKFYSLAISSSNRVFSWGYNQHGQLGDGSFEKRNLPLDITGNFNLNIGETIIDLSAANNHSLAVSSTGRVFSWGFNQYGRLGDGTYQNKNTPVDITEEFDLSSNETITKVLAGEHHSLALSSNNRIFAWGYNQFGQLGDGSQEIRYLPVDITLNLGLTELETIDDLVVGEQHNILTTSHGRFLVWGYNYYGQLGLSNSWVPEELEYLELKETKLIKYATDLNKIDVPVKEGYVFIGWYKDKDLTERLESIPAHDTDVYLKWMKKEYTV